MIKNQIQQIRNLMKEKQIQAYWVPSTDPHQSEYLPDCWNRRSWVSGFTGSAGDLVILEESAALWTDSRYFLQAETQLGGSGIDLMKMGQPDTPTIHQFLKKNMTGKLGIDPRLVSPKGADSLMDCLGKDRVLFLEENLVDAIWEDQPSIPLSPVLSHPIEFSGRSCIEKLTDIRKEMKAYSAEFHVVTQLDAIAWLFNIRGTDVQFNPVTIAYALIGMQDAWLFTYSKKVTDEIETFLHSGVSIADYEGFGDMLADKTRGKSVLVDFDSANHWIIQKLSSADVINKPSPITLLKAKKNETEIEGFKQAHIRDGVAMVSFLIWLEQAVPAGGVTELSAAEKLAGFRAIGERFRGLSFDTISGYAGNGAIVHYSATQESNKTLYPEGIYLVDSGGQYSDGTTDITRTVTLGNPTAQQKDRFTRVLKGHLALANAKFPKGTCGPQLDTLARKPLWDRGLNYGHGTGHGVGSFLCVHEGPQAVSYYRGEGVPMEPGMVISNEPGYYKTGEYGMRIENLIYVKEMPSNAADPSDFLNFGNLTVCPIDRKLVDTELLSPEEKYQFNAYHQYVYETLAPLLSTEEKNWLKKATEVI